MAPLEMDPFVGQEQLKVSGFNHFAGKHCETNAFGKVLAHNGFSLSEEMLFGLGGGIGFIYWHSKRMPTPFVGGRNGAFPGFLSNVARRLKIHLEVIQTNSDKKGYEGLKSILRKGEPALVYGDIAYLPYFMVKRHFGGHAFVVFELDEKRGEALVSDRGENPCTLPLQDLKKARSSRFAPFSPKNAMLQLSYPKEMPPLEQAIYSALRDCYRAMLSPPIRNFGISGIKKWAKLIMKWPEIFKGQNLFECLKDTFSNIELAGTGGSAFRSMYVQFLKESNQILQEKILNDVIPLFEESSRLWSEVACGFLPDSYPYLKRTRELLVARNAHFERQDKNSVEEMKTITEEMDGLRSSCLKELKEAPQFLGEVQKDILRLYDIEDKAFHALSEI